MSSHPWCSDIARDTAIRAAEDAAASERPPLPDHRDLPERVARLEAAVFGVTESRSADARTDETSQSGLRTERVTLEIVRPVVCNFPRSAADFPWTLCLGGILSKGESVRVVPSSEADAEVERLRRDEDQLNRAVEVLSEATNRASNERDAALARVAELEAASGGPPATPAFAWCAEKRGDNGEFQRCIGWDRNKVVLGIDDDESASPISVVPLFRAPPPPRGWLTAEEREALAAGTAALDYDGNSVVLRNLLDRNSPPRVRLPKCPYDHGTTEELCWRSGVDPLLAALAAAGVEVSE